LNSKKNENQIAFLLLTIFLTMLSINGCSSGIKMQSDWQDQEFTLNGKVSDWGTTLHPASDSKINVGFKNDDEFLSLCISTEDRATIMQIMKFGFVVWLEPENGDTKQFGIKYPIQTMPLDKHEMTKDNPDGLFGENLRAAPTEEKMYNRMLEELQKQIEFQVVDKDDVPITAIPVINREGIKIKIGMEKGMLVYELQIPLKRSSDYSFAVGALPGEKIKVKFETLQPDFSDMKKASGEGFGEDEGSGGGRSSGEQREGSMSQRSGRGGRRHSEGAGSINKSETLDYSVELTLTTGSKK
jgi:hypothetical protein